MTNKLYWFPLIPSVCMNSFNLRAQNTLVRIFACFKPNSPCTTDGWGIWPVLRIPFATLRRTKICFNLWNVYTMLNRRTTPLIDNCLLLIFVRIILNASLLKSLNPAQSLSSCLHATYHHSHLLTCFQTSRELLIQLTLETWSYILWVT